MQILRPLPLCENALTITLVVCLTGAIFYLFDKNTENCQYIEKENMLALSLPILLFFFTNC